MNSNYQNESNPPSPLRVNGKVLFTVSEAAQRLSVTKSWLYERTRKNAIAVRRFGRLLRFTDEDLEKISQDAAAGKLK